MSAGFVFVVGMHRSGTSALAGALVQLFDYPVQARPVESNPYGQWERPEMRLQLSALLAYNGATWEHPQKADRPIAAGPLDGTLRRSFQRHCHAPGLWKDPRLCLSIDYWLAVSADVGCDAQVVFVHRDPAEVAESLRVRNGWPHQRGLALWERTNRNAIARLAGREVHVVSYERMMEQPGETLRTLGALLSPKQIPSEERFRLAASTLHPKPQGVPNARISALVESLCPSWPHLRSLHNASTTLPEHTQEPGAVSELVGTANADDRLRAVARGWRTRRQGAGRSK